MHSDVSLAAPPRSALLNTGWRADLFTQVSGAKRTAVNRAKNALSIPKKHSLIETLTSLNNIHVSKTACRRVAVPPPSPASRRSGGGGATACMPGKLASASGRRKDAKQDWEREAARAYQKKTGLPDEPANPGSPANPANQANAASPASAAAQRD